MNVARSMGMLLLILFLIGTEKSAYVTTMATGHVLEARFMCRSKETAASEAAAVRACAELAVADRRSPGSICFL